MHKELKDRLFYNSNRIIFDNAKALRGSQTEAERFLWSELRNRKFESVKFRRQHPIGKYIADFYCHELKLVIEIDGAVHNSQDQKEYDKGRTQELNEKGILVIRFTNSEVENNLQNVLYRLKEFIRLNC
ncbi:MAG: endonuclease domain-containing protein [Bacteroidota bacterium]